MKRIFLFISLLCQIVVLGQESENNTSQNKDVFESYNQLSTQQLFDTANYNFFKYKLDTAIVCYNLLINKIPQNPDIEQQEKLFHAYNKLANIYLFISDYRMAYELFIKTLNICEKYNLISYKSITYLNLGVIYASLNQYSMANQYYLESLNLCDDSIMITLLLNNIGDNNIKKGEIDSVYFFLNKSVQISKQQNDTYLNVVLSTFGFYYQNLKQYDSALYYYRLSLEDSRKKNFLQIETSILSEMGKLFFELNNIDSALYYINLSNKIASENKFLKDLTNNYLTLSEIEKSRGNYKNALNLYTTYTNLKDSISNAEVFSSINLLQRQYEVSKTNQQIEYLEIDRQIKENTIRYQKKNQRIVIASLILAISVMLFILYQYKKLRTAYNVLVEKNIEIIELIKASPNPSEITSPDPSKGGEVETVFVETDNYSSLQVTQNFTEKETIAPLANPLRPCGENKDVNITAKNAEFKREETDNSSPVQKSVEATHETRNSKPETLNSNVPETKKGILPEQAQKEILSKILAFMDNSQEIFNPDFSMDELVNSIHSNQRYVSYVINKILKKNFNSFLNGYRIREAQRLFSDFDTTVEYVANKVGFMSRNSFCEVFKKVTGVTPGFYIKSLHGKDKKT